MYSVKNFIGVGARAPESTAAKNWEREHAPRPYTDHL